MESPHPKKIKLSTEGSTKKSKKHRHRRDSGEKKKDQSRKKHRHDREKKKDRRDENDKEIEHREEEKAHQSDKKNGHRHRTRTQSSDSPDTDRSDRKTERRQDLLDEGYPRRGYRQDDFDYRARPLRNAIAMLEATEKLQNDHIKDLESKNERLQEIIKGYEDVFKQRNLDADGTKIKQESSGTGTGSGTNPYELQIAQLQRELAEKKRIIDKMNLEKANCSKSLSSPQAQSPQSGKAKKLGLLVHELQNKLSMRRADHDRLMDKLVQNHKVIDDMKLEMETRDKQMEEKNEELVDAIAKANEFLLCMNKLKAELVIKEGHISDLDAVGHHWVGKYKDKKAELIGWTIEMEEKLQRGLVFIEKSVQLLTQVQELEAQVDQLEAEKKSFQEKYEELVKKTNQE